MTTCTRHPSGDRLIDLARSVRHLATAVVDVACAVWALTVPEDRR